MSKTRTFDDWYTENADDHNAKRRAKYAADKAFREEARARSKEYRSKNRQRASGKGRTTYRQIGPRRVKVGSIGALGAVIDRSIPTLHYWRKIGRLPESLFSGKQQLYTEYQMGLMKEFSDFLRQSRNPPSVVQSTNDKVHQLWGREFHAETPSILWRNPEGSNGE